MGAKKEILTKAETEPLEGGLLYDFLFVYVCESCLNVATTFSVEGKNLRETVKVFYYLCAVRCVRSFSSVAIFIQNKQECLKTNLKRTGFFLDLWNDYVWER